MSPRLGLEEPASLCSGLAGEVQGLTPSPGTELPLVSSHLSPTPTPMAGEGSINVQLRLNEGRLRAGVMHHRWLSYASWEQWI